MPLDIITKLKSKKYFKPKSWKILSCKRCYL